MCQWKTNGNRQGARRRTVAIGLFVLLTGCQAPAPETTDGPPKIRLQLNWLPDAQFAGYYEALLSGEYEQAGLDVEIKIGGPDAAVLPKLAMGRVEFGLGNADQLLLARQEGADVVAVLAVMQDNPRCIMVHESSGIQSLEELQGVTLAMGEGNAFAQFLKLKLPLDNVRIVSYAGNIAKFMVDDSFAQQGYVFSEPVVARQRGSDPQVLMVSELGFNPYAGIVMTGRKLIEDRPEVVRRFVQATKAGWLNYLSDPSRANAEIHRLNPEIDLASLESAIPGLRQLCFASLASSATSADSFTMDEHARTRFGNMTAERWHTLNGQLTELQLLKPSDKPFVPSSVFTNQFSDTPAAPVTP
jgi:NitT/TauT family transport system substrate-binding protein